MPKNVCPPADGHIVDLGTRTKATKRDVLVSLEWTGTRQLGHEFVVIAANKASRKAVKLLDKILIFVQRGKIGIRHHIIDVGNSGGTEVEVINLNWGAARGHSVKTIPVRERAEIDQDIDLICTDLIDEVVLGLVRNLPKMIESLADPTLYGHVAIAIDGKSTPIVLPD